MNEAKQVRPVLTKAEARHILQVTHRADEMMVGDG